LTLHTLCSDIAGSCAVDKLGGTASLVRFANCHWWLFVTVNCNP
jgi:hypothetical protein